jgi:hypothetical protein
MCAKYYSTKCVDLGIMGTQRKAHLTQLWESGDFLEEEGYTNLSQVSWANAGACSHVPGWERQGEEPAS